MAKVTMPQLGESVAEGTIGKWLKQPGDAVAKYEPLVEVITDKVNAEVPSPFAGVLKEILAEEGATVPNNAEIAVIETADEGDGASPASESTAMPAATGGPAEPATSETPGPSTTEGGGASEKSAGAGSRAKSDQDGSERAAGTAAPSASAATAQASASATSAMSATAPTATGEHPGSPDARMTPAVRRLLREHGLTAAQIVGTGGGGRITREDVTNYVESQRTGQPVGGQSVAAAAAETRAATAAPAGPATSAGAAASPSAAPASAPAAPTASPAAAPPGTPVTFPDGADEYLVPMTQMRKGIATQMTKALQVPHAFVQMEVDVTRLVAFRDKNKRDYQAAEGLSLSYVPFVVKAVAEAVKRHPTLNAHWTDQGVVAKRRVNVGVAVALDDGLVVPVVRDVDQLSINGINRAIADVSSRARANKFKVDDFGGGTFTIDNTGWLGTNLVMPIINVPEVAILTMEAITKRAVVVETPEGDVIAIRPIMNMVLGVDHRANDGAGAAALLRDIKNWLEAIGPDTPIY